MALVRTTSMAPPTTCIPNNLSFGLSTGGVVLKVPRLRLIPSGFLGVATVKNWIYDRGEAIEPLPRHTYGIIGARVGFVVGQVLTIQPFASFLLGLDNSRNVIGVSFALNVGSP